MLIHGHTPSWIHACIYEKKGSAGTHVCVHVWSDTNYLLHKHTVSVSALSMCHLQQPIVVEGCPGGGRGWFGETPSWHISPGWPWHSAATAILKHYLGLCLCHVGLPLDHVSATLPTHRLPKKPTPTPPKSLAFPQGHGNERRHD